jgi:hypothetical protein
MLVASAVTLILHCGSKQKRQATKQLRLAELRLAELKRVVSLRS